MKPMNLHKRIASELSDKITMFFGKKLSFKGRRKSMKIGILEAHYMNTYDKPIGHLHNTMRRISFRHLGKL